MDKSPLLLDHENLMPAKRKRLRVALSRDLRKPGTSKLVEVIDDVPRKIFTAKADGAVLEFPHKQPDQEFWKAKKHYGSGRTSLIKIRRTKVEDTE